MSFERASAWRGQDRVNNDGGNSDGWDNNADNSSGNNVGKGMDKCVGKGMAKGKGNGLGKGKGTGKGGRQSISELRAMDRAIWYVIAQIHNVRDQAVRMRNTAERLRASRRTLRMQIYVEDPDFETGDES